MSAHEPNSPHLTQEALVEQLERQQERISRLETLLQESQRPTPFQPETASVPEREGRTASFAPAQPRPVVSLARLSAWSGWLIASVLDKEEISAESGARLAAPASLVIHSIKTETISAGEKSHYEPTLRFDSAHLRRAHRILEAGLRHTEQNHTGWRTSLILMGLCGAALTLVQWQQHAERPVLPAAPVLQASIAPPQPEILPEPVLQSQETPPAAPTRTLAHTAAAVSHLSQTRPIASAGPSHSTHSKTRSSFASKSGHARTQIAVAAIPNGKPTPPPRLASRSVAPTPPPDEESASSSPDVSEQTAAEQTLANAEPSNDISTNVNNAMKTLDKWLVVLDKMDQKKQKAAQ